MLVMTYCYCFLYQVYWCQLYWFIVNSIIIGGLYMLNIRKALSSLSSLMVYVVALVTFISTNIPPGS